MRWAWSSLRSGMQTYPLETSGVSDILGDKLVQAGHGGAILVRYGENPIRLILVDGEPTQVLPNLSEVLAAAREDGTLKLEAKPSPFTTSIISEALSRCRSCARLGYRSTTYFSMDVAVSLPLIWQETPTRSRPVA